MIYAIVDGGTVIQLFDYEGDIDALLTPDTIRADVTNLDPMPQTGWAAAEADGAWTFTAPETDPLTAEQVLAGKIAAGIALSSTGTPALNATYALDPVSTAQIFQLGLYASQFGSFPGGAMQPYPDATGVPHIFTVNQFVAFLQKVAPLVSSLTTQAAILAHGGQANWPSQTALID